MLRRLYHDQPESFAFTPDNKAWAEAQITKYPEGRQASAVIPLLWRAQEQEGWLSRPAMEEVARMLDMAYIRVLEVATFYFMFQLQPVGSVAHIQICGTTSCMICGAEDLIGVCKDKIAPKAHQLSADGKFSWEEVECLGACANAPMAQIGKDYYEDLTEEKLAWIIDEMAAGRVPPPGPQNGRYASEPAGGLTSLAEYEQGREKGNASVALARRIGDTIKRIDGTEVPLITPWRKGETAAEGEVPPQDDLVAPSVMPGPTSAPTPGPKPSADRPADETGITKQEAHAGDRARPDEGQPSEGMPTQDAAAPRTDAGGAEGVAPTARTKPATLDAPRGGKADDLQQLRGVGPKVATQLNELGIYHFDQLAALNAEELAWLDDQLGSFRGRAIRDDWVGQANEIVTQRKTED
ncbi:NADH-quinone oxidoreductase subunit E [Tranquillimonas alkanivorans]|uniref:NADH dehydrogenase subunit E n=1 Tax=Tranquillimonas alkanivorans TaxID=441119 RepID=A0A1I5SJ31_9RHOB|nr:NADH-quinone oxidoreductase subunit E [Tranquillimonas alkanivorans]SFP70517.1 NADH dehydrogenase subunit E [Tranquillimonas alkanivorans]